MTLVLTYTHERSECAETRHIYKHEFGEAIMNGHVHIDEPRGSCDGMPNDIVLTLIPVPKEGVTPESHTSLGEATHPHKHFLSNRNAVISHAHPHTAEHCEVRDHIITKEQTTAGG